MSQSRKHLLLIGFPAYGHMIPLLELGKKIVQHHNVTFAVSACMLDEIQKRELISAQDFPLIGIPDGFTNPPVDKMGSQEDFDAMMNSVMPGARKFLEAIPIAGSTTASPVGIPDALGITTPVDVVIGDNMLAGPLAVCHARNILFHFFNTAAATMTLGALLIDENYPTIPSGHEDDFPFSEIPPPGAPLPPIPEMFKTLFLPISQNTHLVSGVIVNSVRDIEQEVLETIKNFPVMKDIPVRFVGPLVPVGEKISLANLEQREKVKKWLNAKDNLSVVYVSFGSIAAPQPEQISEIARALLKLGKPVIWSLRLEHHKHLPEEISSKIAQQFERNDGQFLILHWTPQKLILQHPATAVFLSHCGWNSTLESVSAGIPVLAWPMFADQKLNAEWLVKRSTAIMLEGTKWVKPERVVPAEEIENIIYKLSGWSGNVTDTVYREAAQTWKVKVNEATEPGGSSDNDFRDLIKFGDKNE